MGIIGSATGSNEAVCCEYISPILYASIYKSLRKELPWTPSSKLQAKQVDYTIKKVIDVVNELIAISEGKQKDLVSGFMQNIMQLESSHHTNTRKGKASVAFNDEFNYLYGIVTTGRAFRSLCDFFINCLYILTRAFLCLASDWYFLMYTLERIYCSKSEYHVVLTEDILENDE